MILFIDFTYHSIWHRAFALTGVGWICVQSISQGRWRGAERWSRRTSFCRDHKELYYTLCTLCTLCICMHLGHLQLLAACSDTRLSTTRCQYFSKRNSVQWKLKGQQDQQAGCRDAMRCSHLVCGCSRIKKWAGRQETAHRCLPECKNWTLQNPKAAEAEASASSLPSLCCEKLRLIRVWILRPWDAGSLQWEHRDCNMHKSVWRFVVNLWLGKSSASSQKWYQYSVWLSC